MNASCARRLFLLAALLAAIVIVPAARAQEDDRAPVRLDGRTLFRVGPSGEPDHAALAPRVALRREGLPARPHGSNPGLAAEAGDDADEHPVPSHAAAPAHTKTDISD